MLTERQQQIWDYLVEYVDGHGYPPTVREIGDHVGLASPSTVHAHLENLERNNDGKFDNNKFAMKDKFLELKKQINQVMGSGK